jgi:hypothetical protein
VVSNRIEMREADMIDSGTPIMSQGGTPIMSQAARFRVGGIGRGQGIVLLYPDKLAAVNSSAELWGIVLGSVVLTASSHFLFHDIYGLGSAAGAMAGGWIGQGVGKRLAAERAGADRDSVRLIPLDSITSVRFRNSAGIRAWLLGRVLVVTTADGTEHQFRGRLAGWQAALTGALTIRGYDVQDTPQGITVTSRALPGTG